MLLFPAVEENDAPDILSLRFHVSVFIGIQKRTLNFSLWKCIVCWIVASVPRGVENNTPSHWEKYYCQIFWDALFESLSFLSASMWSHGVIYLFYIPYIYCLECWQYCVLTKKVPQRDLLSHVAGTCSKLCVGKVSTASADRWEEIKTWIELQKVETGRWRKHERLPTSMF